jgi:2-phospho-L-lactate/phosphoenolpyruvate guanylyltransferase
MPLLTTIVPAKRCSLAKQRLSTALNADERSMLAIVMFHDVMIALSGLRPKSHILVVTADTELGSIARSYDAEVMLDRWEDGVTRAVREATMAMSDRGFDTAMIIPADVPLVQPGELRELLRTHAERGITIVPADSDQGTNAIIASPPKAIAFNYGPNSLYRHLDQVRQAGLTARVMKVAGLNLDVDRPSDLIRVLASDRMTRTKAYLSTLSQGGFNPSLASATPPPASLDCTADQRDEGASK